MELPNRAQHEQQFARRLSQVSSRHRRELVRLLGNPPDPARVPQSFWDRVQREEEEVLLFALLLLFMESGEFHGLDADTARQLGQPWADQRSKLVATGYVKHSRDRLGGMAERWRERQTTIARDRGFPETAPHTPLPPVEIEGDALEIFGPDRDATIATNETTTAVTEGGENAMDEQGLTSPEDKWKTNPHLSSTGPCRICAPLDGTTRDYWERFFPAGPPAHVSCVCEIVYANVPAAVGAR